jgi:hypothetical protein
VTPSPQYHLTDTAKRLVAGLQRETSQFNRGLPLFVANGRVAYKTVVAAERPGVSPFTLQEVFLTLVDADGNVVEGCDWSDEDIEAAYRALHQPRW